VAKKALTVTLANGIVEPIEATNPFYFLDRLIIHSLILQLLHPNDISFCSYFLLPYSINSLLVDKINPINVVQRAISTLGRPAAILAKYGATKYIPAFPNILANGL